MHATDERGQPLVVEAVGIRAPTLPYLASGWSSGEGRYAAGFSPEDAIERWLEGWFLPRRQRPSSATV